MIEALGFLWAVFLGLLTFATNAKLMHEARAFAEIPQRTCTGPIAGITAADTLAGQTKPRTGFLHVIAITDCVLANVVFRYPRTESGASDSAVTLSGGKQLGGVKSFDLTSGQAQILFID